MVSQQTVWHGTQTECEALMNALRRSGVTASEAREVLGDQHIIDRLLFVRRTRERWQSAEWNVSPRKAEQ